MSIYINTGKLGSGKSLLAVKRIRDYLQQGRRVATNLDLRMEHLLGAMDRSTNVSRIPDKPCVDDLECLGAGCDTVDESRYGLIVLDELGAWLNSRQWGDKSRQAVIDWLLHSRKKGWDVLFIVQNINMIDKQIREALCEFHVHCKRLDKVKIPFFGLVGRILTLGLWNGRIGKVHLGVVVDVANSTAQSPTVVDRWIYRGHDLYEAYDTRQIFTSAEQAPYSLLSGWHVKGRYLAPRRSFFRALWAWCAGEAAPKPTGTRKPKLPAVKHLEQLPLPRSWDAARRMWLRTDGVCVAPLPLRYR